MVNPHEERYQGNTHQRVDHHPVAKERLAAECAGDFSGHTQVRQQHHIHRRVRVEPEELLIQHRNAANAGVKPGDTHLALEDSDQHGAGQTAQTHELKQ